MLHSICQHIWKTQPWSQDCKTSDLIPIPKKGNVQECSIYCTIALISHASKVMLKILQARLQKYVNWEIPDVQAGFRKGRGTRDQIPNIRWVIEKARVPEKHLRLLYWLSQCHWLCGSQQTGEFLKRRETRPPYSLLRNLYGAQEAAVKTRHGTMDWFQFGKGVRQGCILSPWLFNLYVEYIMRNGKWMKHKLKSRLLGEISTTSDMQMIPPLWQKV